GAAEGLVASRAEGVPFRDLGDLCTRLDGRLLNKGMLEALIGAGALDSFAGHRAQQMAALDTCLEYGKDQQEDKLKGQGNLFAAMGSSATPSVSLPNVPVMAERELLIRERELTGLFLTRHPLEAQWGKLKSIITKPIGTLSADDAGTKLVVAGLISGLQRKRSKSLALYAVLKLEDVTGGIETLIFPQSYDRAKDIIEDDAVVVCAGRLQIDERDSAAGEGEDETTGDRPVRLKFLCDDVMPLEQVLQSGIGTIFQEARRGGRYNGNSNGNGQAAPPPPPRQDLDLGELVEAFSGAPTVHLELPLNGNTRVFAEYLLDFMRDHPGASPVRLTILHGDDRLVAELGANTMDASKETILQMKQQWPDLSWAVE
ncbi:MAG: hypothetical protein ABI743_12500, partial [bacterium]